MNRNSFWAQLYFEDFVRHFRKMDDAAIVADVRQSMDDFENRNPDGISFGAEMVASAFARIQKNREKFAGYGIRGGRPRKNTTLPGTSSGNGEAPNDEGATAPAGQLSTPVPVSAQAVPEQGALPPEASTGRVGNISTPVPVSGTGDCPDGGLLTPWYGPATGEPFGGDAATREGAEAVISGFATSPSEFQNQKRPGKSATSSGVLVASGGSERGAGGSVIAVRRSPGAKDAEPKLRYGSAGNVLMTGTEMARLAAEFGDVRQITEELSDYLLLHPNKYRSHYAALRNWCRRRIREGRNPDGTKMTQGDRLARHFAEREREILDGKEVG